MRCKLQSLSWIEVRNQMDLGKFPHFHFSLVTRGLEEELFQKTL